MPSTVLAAYLTVKLAVYCFVCLLGIAWLRPAFKNRYAACVTLGAGRLLLGVGLGLLIYMASTKVYAAVPDELPRGLVTYLAVYVPTRWVEWSMIALVISPAARSVPGFLFGAEAGDRLWRCIGIVASCIADIPVFLAVGGLPVGRFFC